MLLDFVSRNWAHDRPTAIDASTLTGIHPATAAVFGVAAQALPMGTLPWGVTVSGDGALWAILGPVPVRSVEIVFDDRDPVPLSRDVGGWWSVQIPQQRRGWHGQRYCYRIDGHAGPDPAARWLDEAGDRPLRDRWCRVMDPAVIAEVLADDRRPRIPWEDLRAMEGHPSRYLSSGSVSSPLQHCRDVILPHLRRLQLNAMALMPIHASAHPAATWGYDSGLIWAISGGGPVELARLARACHQEGVALILDEVFSHVHPDSPLTRLPGAVCGQTPWGPIPAFHGWMGSYLEQALLWKSSFCDGFRIDAVNVLTGGDRYQDGSVTAPGHNGTTLLRNSRTLCRRAADLRGHLWPVFIGESLPEDHRIVGDGGCDLLWSCTAAHQADAIARFGTDDQIDRLLADLDGPRLKLLASHDTVSGQGHTRRLAAGHTYAPAMSQALHAILFIAHPGALQLCMGDEFATEQPFHFQPSTGVPDPRTRTSRAMQAWITALSKIRQRHRLWCEQPPLRVERRHRMVVLHRGDRLGAIITCGTGSDARARIRDLGFQDGQWRIVLDSAAGPYRVGPTSAKRSWPALHMGPDAELDIPSVGAVVLERDVGSTSIHMKLGDWLRCNVLRRLRR
jgi:1,4-alpha-glucan branching enzyme